MYILRICHLCVCVSSSFYPAAATAGPGGVQRSLQDGVTEFSVTGSSGEEYLVEFSDETGAEVVITESEDVPVETTVVVVGGVITTVMVGTDTFTVIYDSNGDVVSVDPAASTSRRTQQAGLTDRRLATCEEGCAASSNQVCGAFTAACLDPTSTLGTILGPLCDDLDGLCNLAGILKGCDRTCAPGESAAYVARESAGFL